MAKLAACLVVLLLTGCTTRSQQIAAPLHPVARVPATTTTVEADDEEASTDTVLSPVELPPTALRGAPSAGCRTGNPLANVYHPSRLDVLSPCQMVSGMVGSVRHESDGDFHINLELDPEFAGMINSRNVRDQNGDLVTEVVPADESTIPTPKVGSHVTVVGPYVLDRTHGWMEIHPVWSLVVDPVAAPASPLVAPEPLTSAPVHSPAASTASPQCAPAYPDFCVPPAPPDLDCADVAPHQNFAVIPPDPHHFDADHDGIGCEHS